MVTIANTAGRPARGAKLEIALAFVLPLSALVKASFGGTLFGQDALALLLLPLLIAQPGSGAKLRAAAPFYLAAAVYLGGQVVTDLIDRTALEDWSRGWSKIIFLVIQFTVLWLFLTRRWQLFLAYMLGSAIASIISIRSLQPPFSDYPWKFGLGIGILTVCAVVGSWIGLRSRRSSWQLSAALLLAAAALALLHNARSLFGTGTFAALYVVLAGIISRKPGLRRKITPTFFAMFLLGGLLIAQGMMSVYAIAAEAGALGPDARLKYEEQTSGDLGLLQGGRVETLVSVQAIKDSPIIGHGSWAHDVYYVRLLHQKLIENGIRGRTTSEGDDDLIPSHSHLFGAWVEAGVAGAIFWLWAMWLAIVTLYKLLKVPDVPSPIVVLSAFLLLWDVLFSPFGADVRFVRASELALLLYIVRFADLRIAPLATARRIVRSGSSVRASAARRLS